MPVYYSTVSTIFSSTDNLNLCSRLETIINIEVRYTVYKN